jgi:hypothetical protein
VSEGQNVKPFLVAPHNGTAPISSLPDNTNLMAACIRMPTSNKRRVFEEGHRRKFLVILDEKPGARCRALLSPRRRASHTGGSLVLLYVIEPQDFQHWMGVKEIQKEEETQKAKALFRLVPAETSPMRALTMSCARM